MATEFDPYHKWLGIPAAEQPVNLYRLLALNLFESDPDVIDMAADSRMMHLRSLQHGHHLELNQKLLNHIAAARHCLLKPETKAQYDAELRAQLGRRAALQTPRPAAATEIVSPAAAMLSAPLPIAAALDFLSDANQPAASGAGAANPLGFEPEPAPYRSAKTKSLAARRKQRSGPKLLFVLVPLLAIAAIAVAMFIHNTQDADAPTVATNGGASSAAASSSLGAGPNQKHTPEATPTKQPPAKQPVVAAPAKVVGDDQTKEPEKTASRTPQEPPAAEQPVVPPPANVAIGDPVKATSTEPASTGPVEKIVAAPTKAATGDGPKPAVSDVAPDHRPSSVELPAGAGDLPMGQWVDVLRLVDPTRDSVAGKWSRQGAELVAEPGDHGRITVPVGIAGGFDLELDFTRNSGKAGVGTMFSVGSHQTMVVLSGWSGNASGLIIVGGHDASDEANPIAVRPGNLENGHRYRLLVSLRILADDRASLDVSLDGKPYLPHWEGDSAALSNQSTWEMPQPGELGIGAHQNDVTFHSARLRMISGHASVEKESNGNGSQIKFDQ